MLVACLLAALALFSAASAPDGHCPGLDEDTEETSLVLTHSVQTKKSGYELGDFDTSSASGYFQPTTQRYRGKKTFFSKNSCATVLYCLKAAYTAEGDESAWGRVGPAVRTGSKRRALLDKACTKRGLRHRSYCSKRRSDARRSEEGRGSGRQLGPDAHVLCASQNLQDQEQGSRKGCSEWMQPFMNQMALTLGSSSYELNLFLDFGSEGIAHCFHPKYDQKCVNASLTKSVEEADIFVYFPDFFVGKSCAIEAEVAEQVAAKRKNTDRPLHMIKLEWDTYFAVFHEFENPPNPSTGEDEKENLEENWRAGARAAVFLIDQITSEVSLQPVANEQADCLPAGQCVAEGKESDCCSGHWHWLFTKPCCRDYDQGELTPKICG